MFYCLRSIYSHLWILWVKGRSLANLSFYSLSIYSLLPLVSSAFVSCRIANENNSHYQFNLLRQRLSSQRKTRFYTGKLSLQWWEAIQPLWKRDVNVCHVHYRNNRLKTIEKQLHQYGTFFYPSWLIWQLLFILLEISISIFSWSISVHPLKPSLGVIFSEILPMNITLDLCDCLPLRL